MCAGSPLLSSFIIGSYVLEIYQPAKRHSREPSLRRRESGDEKEREDTDDLLYYAPRQDELPESTPDIGFLLGESEVALSPTTADAEEEKPVRLLRDWAVFDARPSKAKDAGGALALALIPLHVLDDAALDSTDAGCAPEGAGDASPYCENEEDAGQEDDGDYGDDDSTGDEEEGAAVSMRLRLGAILRYTIDYTKHNEYVPSYPFHSLLCRHERPMLIGWCWDPQPDIPRDHHGLVHPRRPCA